ncbi:phage tail protein [Ottowia sp.]|uniref:phage tail protein n=1 Tax=Ottowia sp. TaxID=1898956 RepID=UPI003A8A112E
MLKLNSLRATILAAVQRTKQDNPAEVVVLTDGGRIISTGTDSLSFEMQYTALVWVLGLAEHPDVVLLPVLAWHKLQQQELYADPAKTDRAFEFNVQLLDDPGVIDLHLRLSMTERVIVQYDAAGHVTATHHAPEPGPLGFADKPERWQIDLQHPGGERETIATFDGPALPRAQSHLAAMGIDVRRA